MELGILFAVLFASAVAFIVTVRRVVRMVSSLRQTSNQQADVEEPTATDADVSTAEVVAAPATAVSEHSEAVQSAVAGHQEAAVVSSTPERPLRGDEIERLAEIERALETHLRERARLVERISSSQDDDVSEGEIAEEDPALSKETVGDGLGPKHVFTEELKKVVFSIMEGDDSKPETTDGIASDEAKQGLAEASAAAEDSPIKKTVRKKGDTPQ